MTRSRPVLRPVAYLVAGAITGVVTYLLVAPFTCRPSGTCEGWIAFDYHPDSAGHLQAASAGLLLGACLSALLWLAAKRPASRESEVSSWRLTLWRRLRPASAGGAASRHR